MYVISRQEERRRRLSIFWRRRLRMICVQISGMANCSVSYEVQVTALRAVWVLSAGTRYTLFIFIVFPTVLYVFETWLFALMELRNLTCSETKEQMDEPA